MHCGCDGWLRNGADLQSALSEYDGNYIRCCPYCGKLLCEDGGRVVAQKQTYGELRQELLGVATALRQWVPDEIDQAHDIRSQLYRIVSDLSRDGV